MEETGFVVYGASVEGISLEHVNRRREHNMSVRHFHDEYEIFYIMDGQRQFYFNNRSFLAGKGDLILIDSNMIHMTRSPDQADPGYERLILYITSEKMAQMDAKFPELKIAAFFRNNPGIYRLSPEQQAGFLQTCDNFRREETGRAFGYAEAIEANTVLLLLHLVRELTDGESILPLYQEEKYKSIYQLADYLSAHYAEHYSLDQLAAKFYLSKFYMCRLFRRAIGYSVSEYQTILRIQKAKEYLEKTKWSVSAIAERVGYNSLTHFEREFKRYMNVSPLRYRGTLNTVTAFDVSTDFKPSADKQPADLPEKTKIKEEREPAPDTEQ